MSKNLDRYLDAIRELRSLRIAQAEDGKTLDRTQAIKDAEYLVRSYAAHLTAREHWQATRLLKVSA
jgi:hypothetical protein